MEVEPDSYLQLQNPLLNAASNDEACHMDGLVLTQPVDAVLCLLLHSWIPPVTAVGKVYRKKEEEKPVLRLLLHSWIPPVTTVGKVLQKNTKK